MRDGEASPPLLIHVLVTGIQPAKSLAERLFHAADAALLDPCDKHRDEGGKPPTLFLIPLYDRRVLASSAVSAVSLVPETMISSTSCSSVFLM